MMTDPIADMLNRIRNAIAIERPFVDVPHSKTKVGIADVLQREGYIWDYEVIDQPPGKLLRINLKYGPNGERVIQQLKRVSTPGRRIYKGRDGLPSVQQGMGIHIVTTSQGILSDREARGKGVGGEVICTLW